MKTKIPSRDKWTEFEARKAEINRTSKTWEERDRRIRELVDELEI